MVAEFKKTKIDTMSSGYSACALSINSDRVNFRRTTSLLQDLRYKHGRSQDGKHGFLISRVYSNDIRRRYLEIGHITRNTMKLRPVASVLIRVYRTAGPVSHVQRIRYGAVLNKNYSTVSAVKDCSALLYRKHGEPSKVVQ